MNIKPDWVKNAVKDQEAINENRYKMGWIFAIEKSEEKDQWKLYTKLRENTDVLKDWKCIAVKPDKDIEDLYNLRAFQPFNQFLTLKRVVHLNNPESIKNLSKSVIDCKITMNGFEPPEMKNE